MPRKKPENPKDKMVHVRLSEDDHRKLKVLVAEKGVTIQDWIHKLIESKLQK